MSEHNHVVNKDGEVALGKVDDALNRIDDERQEEILQSFESFKKYLGERVKLAQSMGMSEETMAQAAEKVGNYLAAKEDPRNREEKLLQELWNAGDQEHRHALAHMLVRLAQKAH
ncbi:DUF3243 domain-containing protein [Paenibacillus sp. alder61]|uniref:DUF3243 domain-containing protein n=1 Tax=Paenibacillus sp. alder61 TaxID=2862948 RepID=UPI001CD1F639|nr:DUF3243 domain-containing protein [Paenibacillus sp. alder61]MCA1294087.1 DUF3243 domain-containing protein [Paenibacillus sp. alder61]